MRDHPRHNSIRHANIFSILSSINIYPLLNTVLKKLTHTIDDGRWTKACQNSFYFVLWRAKNPVFYISKFKSLLCVLSSTILLMSSICLLFKTNIYCTIKCAFLEQCLFFSWNEPLADTQLFKTCSKFSFVANVFSISWETWTDHFLTHLSMKLAR